MATGKNTRGRKSAAKKAAAKPRKTAAKTPSTRRRAKARAELVHASAEKAFWVNFGPVLYNLRDLRDAVVDGITDEQLRHHVNDVKHDFANWVEHVLDEAAVAGKLRAARTRAAIAKVLNQRLKA